MFVRPGIVAAPQPANVLALSDGVISYATASTEATKHPAVSCASAYHSILLYF